jgi:hypothetical protein
MITNDQEFIKDQERALYIFVEAMNKKSPQDFHEFTGYPLTEIVELFSTAFAVHMAIQHDITDEDFTNENHF